MQSLNPIQRADTQLWGTNYMHVMNIADEVVTGQERLGWQKADVGWVSTSMYKLRPLATIWETGAIAVPEGMLVTTRELNRYHSDIGVNSLWDERIVPVHGMDKHGYSMAIIQMALSMKSHLERLNIDTISGFIESKNLQEARKNMWLHDTLNVPYQIVDVINNKWIFLEAMSEIGVPVAYGKTLFHEQDVRQTFLTMKNMWAKQVYAKLSRAASGQWVFAIDINRPEWLDDFLSLPQTQEQINTIGVRLDYGIEGIINSPNFMMYVGKNLWEDRFISASSQILAKKHESDERATVHKWNISGIDQPLLEKLSQYSQKVACWMRSKWAYGIVGLDYVVTEEQEIYIMEANYRVNGGLAAAMKWHDLGAPFWAANGWVKVPENTSLQEYILHLQGNGIEYNKTNNSWVIILNPATSPAWAIQIAILWKTQEQILDIMKWVDMK